MLKKYQPIRDDMFEFIRNKTTAGFSPESIADEVVKRFRIELAYYKCDQEMVKEFITQLCQYAQFMYTNKLN